MAYGLPDWLTGSSSAPPRTPQREKSQDGGYIAPDRSKREMCYDSRDLLFSCLDKHDILDATAEDEKSRKLCGPENEAYEKDCARTWIKYFKEKRVYDWKREQALKQIQADDARMQAQYESAKKKKSWLS